jgi:hypothetical protein
MPDTRYDDTNTYLLLPTYIRYTHRWPHLTTPSCVYRGPLSIVVLGAIHVSHVDVPNFGYYY